MSDKYDEFLRRCIIPGAVTGYPARGVTALLFSNPVATAEGDLPGSAQSVFARWKLMSDRLFVHMDRLPFRQDISGSTGISLADVEVWLATPVSYGGAGYVVRPIVPDRILEIETQRKVMKVGNAHMAGADSMKRKYPGEWDSFVLSTIRPRPWRRLPKWRYYYGEEVPGLESVADPRQADVLVGPRLREVAFGLQKPYYASERELRSPTETKIGTAIVKKVVLNPLAVQVRKSSSMIMPRPEVSEEVGMTLAGISDDTQSLVLNSEVIIGLLGDCSVRVLEDALLGRMDMSCPPLPGLSAARMKYESQIYINNMMNVYVCMRRKKTHTLWQSMNLAMELCLRKKTWQSMTGGNIMYTE